MKISDLKYFVAYLIPATGFVSVFASGFMTWSAVIFAFVIIPSTEFFVNKSTKNLTKDQEIERLSNRE